VKVLNFGSLNYDYVYQMDHIVRPGETLTSSGRDIVLGGKGLNQSIALARAGVTVYHAGAVGEDGGELVNYLKENGVNVQFVRTLPGPSGHAVIQVDKNGQNSIILFTGANRKQEKAFIDEVIENFGEGDYLLLQNEINELPYIIEKAYEKKMKIVLNPSPFDEYLKACDMGKISLFIMNEIEGKELTGESEPAKILEKVQSLYPQADVVLTLGEDGSCYKKGGEITYQGIVKVKAVDTTAAGDTFTGYFLAGIAEELSPAENLARCAKASAITVSRKGAAPSIPLKTEL